MFGLFEHFFQSFLHFQANSESTHRFMQNWYFYKIIEKLLILDSESDAAEAADLYAVPGLDPDRYFKRAGFVGMRGKKQSDYASNYASYLRRPTLYDAMARNIRAGFVGMRG